MKPQTEVLPALALIAIFSLCGAVSAQASPEPHLRTGMFGVAHGQVARINAVIGNPDAVPIQVEMMYLDATGNVVGRYMKTVMPGHAAFFDVMFDALMPGDANRIELRAIVNVLGGPDTKNLVTTVEVFDSDTGRNTTYIIGPEY